jgi:hypothetical protein
MTLSSMYVSILHDFFGILCQDGGHSFRFGVGKDVKGSLGIGNGRDHFFRHLLRIFGYCLASSALVLTIISVAMGPGWTLITRVFCDSSSSRRNAYVMEYAAALLVLYVACRRPPAIRIKRRQRN